MWTTVLLIWKELLHRWSSFLLGAAALTAAVALCVALAITETASQRETRRVTRDLGFNLRIIPRETDMEQFYLTGYSEQTMPENSLDTLARMEKFSYNHLVASLQRKIQIAGHRLLLMGISGEQAPPGKKKPPMIFSVEPGTVHVGHEVARLLKLKKGDSLPLDEESLRVARTMPETGTVDDIRVIGLLSDVQRLLGLEGKINEIKAIDCLCLSADENPQAILQSQLQQALPEARVVMQSSIAEARARQRQMTEKQTTFVMGAVLLVAAAWIGAMAIMNVRQRYGEIGLFRALGYGSATIGSLVLGRAVLIGLAAAWVGYFLGTWLALTCAPEIFPVTARAIRSQPQLLPWAMLAAPLLAAVASLIPAAIAITKDPADVLRKS
jgi:predicted lysophospholipase L1 biosynthesis ABC-type transport system permease subunit